ncbi:hypothetical protein ABZ858_17185 [Streptomyces sp. NPDC047017]|uniref:hypothetical protein n=1 Tax=Streptomyces sp. NPDC047017 TaxID=3155024 RepID=UPI0033D337E9
MSSPADEPADESAGARPPRDIADPRPRGPRDLGRFDAVGAFFSLLVPGRAEIPDASAAVRHLLPPGGLFVLSMVEAGLDDVPIPFPGRTIRCPAVHGPFCARWSRRRASKGVEEFSRSYAPAGTDGRPGERLFLCCRQTVPAAVS